MATFKCDPLHALPMIYVAFFGFKALLFLYVPFNERLNLLHLEDPGSV